MTEWLKTRTTGRPVEVDRDAGVLRGYVVAQEGPFKSEGRGEFDGKSLRTIARLMRREPKGLKSRFAHPDMSNDGLGKYLGRARDPFMDTVTILRDGESVQLEAVRADLHFADSASATPSGDLAGYVMDLASEDSDAISSSLVLEREVEYRLEKDGTPRKDDDGNELPPLWRPLRLHASDIVDTGDAVDGLLSASLSAEGLPNEVVYRAAELLRSQFAGKDREFVQHRLSAWCERVLDHYWPDTVENAPALTTAALQQRFDLDNLLGSP
jgi:hypothetical protein